MASQKKPRAPGVSTLAIHGGQETRVPGTPITTPLTQSVNYVQDFGTAEGLMYTRYGNIPNEEIIQKRIASLEGAEAALVLVVPLDAVAFADAEQFQHQPFQLRLDLRNR